MGLIVSLLTGAFIGWVASILMKTSARQGLLQDLVVGVVGAGLGQWLFVDVPGVGVDGGPGVVAASGVVWSILGACLFIAMLRVLRRLA